MRLETPKFLGVLNLEYLEHFEPLEQIVSNIAGLASVSTSIEDWSAGQELLMARSVSADI